VVDDVAEALLGLLGVERVLGHQHEQRRGPSARRLALSRYAKVIAGLEPAAHDRIEKALEWQGDEGPTRGGTQGP